MGRKELKFRTNWQTTSGSKAKNTEQTLTEVLTKILPSQDYSIESQVQDFKDEYSDHILPDSIQDVIYDPGQAKIEKSHWGWVPDNAIINNKTGKKIYIEIKRQDGWTSETEQKAGRGNAHERGLKHFAPGILEKEKSKSGITDSFLPFIIIYVGDITIDPRRNREIHYWFKNHEDNYFMWRKNKNKVLDIDELKEYLETKVLPHLN